MDRGDRECHPGGDTSRPGNTVVTDELARGTDPRTGSRDDAALERPLRQQRHGASPHFVARGQADEVAARTKPDRTDAQLMVPGLSRLSVE